MTNEEIEVEEIGLGKEIIIEDCPDIPNEVNDSVELRQKVIMKTSPIKEARRGMGSPQVLKHFSVV